MSQPLVTIVTPTYNGGKFLREAMESVQAQTYPNLLHIVLDNASTDDTPNIIDDYRNGRVRLETHRNDELLPQRPNWNKAFSYVSDESKYVRLLCDDDTITPDSIAKMVALAEAHPEVGVVSCLHYCLGGVTDFRWPEDQNVFEAKEAMRRALLDEGTFMPIHMMWRKSVADQRDILFDDFMKGGFDLDTMYDLVRRSAFGFIHEVLAFTRVHEGTVSAATSTPAKLRARDANDLLLKYGPEALGDAYPEQARRFRRHYVKSIRRWKREGMPEKFLEIHREGLEQAGASYGFGAIADAAVNKLAIQLGQDKPWTGYPGWL